MVEDIVFRFGYLGLFVVSFLAATLLPLSSEVLVASMPVLGYEVRLILIFATAGNYLSALTNYFVGKLGGRFVFARCIKVEPEKLLQAQSLFSRWGTPILFFSWVPIIGDPLTVVGGLLKVNLRYFTFWVLLGKTFRYAFILVIADLILG